MERNNYDISSLFSKMDACSEGEFLEDPTVDSTYMLNEEKNEMSADLDFEDEKDIYDKIIRPGVTLGDVSTAIFWLGSIAKDQEISSMEREFLDFAVYELSKFYFKDFYKTKHLPKVVEAVENIREMLISEKSMAKE